MKSLAILLTFLCSSFAVAQSAKLKPLYFQADKNNLQVLPQRFEYTLLDADRLKLGDILIDSTKVTFSIEKSTQDKKKYQIRFTWPAGLLKEGDIAIKNNSGKAIFNAPLKKADLKFYKADEKEQEEPLRSEMAELTLNDIDPNVIDDMRYLPFMVFCIYRETEGTRLYLCSNELYLASQQGQLAVKNRQTSKKVPQVEINGKVVGNQGMIYLNNRSEEVAFKAQTQSGSFIEIETRKKDVDFKDVIVSEDGKKMLLTASGAEPVDESKVKHINATDWQIVLPTSRPILYLKGEGDIPMRQEFYVKGNLPKEKIRPYLSARSANKTYSSKLQFAGVSPEGSKLNPAADDRNSQIQNKGKNQFQWTVSNIPSGLSRHYLNIETSEGAYITGYDISRDKPFVFSLGANYLTPAGVAYGQVELKWWIEDLFAMNSDFSLFHWGLGVEREQQILKKDGELKADFTTVELLWRAKEGFYLVDGTWGLSVPMQMIQAESASVTSFGVGLFWNSKTTSRWAQSMMDWSEFKLQYFVGGSADNFKLKSAYNFQAQALVALSERWFWRYGLSYRDYKFEPAASTKEAGQFGLNTNLVWKF